VLAPFLKDAPDTLLPRVILIEDSRHEWKVDLFALFADKGYAVTLRTKQNVVLRRNDGSIQQPSPAPPAQSPPS
jgi:hypothetical protein